MDFRSLCVIINEIMFYINYRYSFIRVVLTKYTRYTSFRDLVLDKFNDLAIIMHCLLKLEFQNGHQKKKFIQAIMN